MNENRLMIKLLVVILIFAFAFFLLEFGIDRVRSDEYLILCASNLRTLGKALQLYANNYDGQYPPEDKWCNFLVEHTSVEKRYFFCKSAEDGSYSTKEPIDDRNFPAEVVFCNEYNDINGQHLYTYSIKWCHYAINPKAKPNSPADVVLLFETKHGWNQFGGPEILNDENHLKLEGRKGCNILFNDGSVKFIEPEQFGELKWKNEQKQ
jgi:prepilin-type processing-associated H-X9-DG protein